MKEYNNLEDDHIVTKKDEKRRYKNCRCCVCNTVSRCTFENDFYSTNDHGDGIVCEKCFHEYLRKFL
jgi:hypothetical protein